jgi:ATP-dependent DNA helicase RecG
MKSKQSNTSKVITWGSSLEELFPKGLTKSAEKLKADGYTHLNDLLWLLPLRIQELPGPQKFSQARESYLFCGRGEVISKRSSPNFKARGKRGAMLINITVIVRDLFSGETISLRWFNSYSSILKKIENSTHIEFFGTVQNYQGQKQISNPEFNDLSDITETLESLVKDKKLKIQYPTVNTVGPANIKKIIDKIPTELWSNIPETLPLETRETRKFLSLEESFRILHGKTQELDKWSERNEDFAKERLIYEEFFREQIKIHLRRAAQKKPKAQKISTNDDDLKLFSALFPFELTKDQDSVLVDIQKDLSSDNPMMRMIQGDVGCGKTSVAIISALFAVKNDKQAALMCPTESLALQHFLEVKKLLKDSTYKVEILLGGTTAKEKKDICAKLYNGEIDFIIGTHSLIQETVKFRNLGIAIIDEQHKFGVSQRQKLVAKTKGCHCLIMTATPIPRSLSLTQFGDLDISTIKTMPTGRKGHKTRIITPENFEKFLTFINTRLSMKEQVYVVVPAINESAAQEMLHLQQVLDKFSEIFSNYRIKGLHGQMKSEEKSDVFKEFKKHEIDILVATSVIEVGINVLNATVMAIMNPERFGLSSLHQLRGRVGRGDKPGFCFLVNDKKVSQESMQRLKVIENSSDGFKIAEEDLKIRGEGDLFGQSQSGAITSKKLANIIVHQPILIQAKEDILRLIKEKNPSILSLIEEFATDQNIFSTI